MIDSAALQRKKPGAATTEIGPDSVKVETLQTWHSLLDLNYAADFPLRLFIRVSIVAVNSPDAGSIGITIVICYNRRV